MMKFLGRLLLFSILLILPLQANADDWNKYAHITDRFYNIDKQEFNSISCNIEIPMTKNLLKQLHTQLEPVKKNIEIKENIVNFSLIYSKKSGLNINRPSFDIKIISEEGLADPAQVKKGIEIVKTGFNQQIDGTVMQLNGLFEGFETPKKSQYKIIEIKHDNSDYSARYEKDNCNFTETYQNNQRKINQICKNGNEIYSVEDYKYIANNKLFLTDAQAIINNAIGNMEINMTISYKKINEIVFPNHIESHVKQSVQTIKQEGQVDIYLNDCILR